VEAHDIPDGSNLYGALDTTLPPERVARLFAPFGWAVRRCTWTDYELTCDWAELVIERESQSPHHLLIHGPVADLPTNLPRIIEPLAAAGVPYSLECYNAERELIHHARG
jgi:hypothetical protein